MPEDLSDILETTEPVLLATGFGATEGPVWHPDGYLTFVDYDSSQLLRWDTSGGVTVVREDTGRGNGCTLDREGRLIMCEAADHRRITRMEADGSTTTLAERWQGKRLSRPNDVVCASDGSIYFTDPELQLARELRELGFSGLFRIDPNGELHLVNDECEYPNGLALSLDESILYIAISRRDERCFQEEARGEVCTHRLIRAFDVAPNGTLSSNRVFVDMSSEEPGVPDGIKVDSERRIFCTGSGGIWVIDPDGRRIGIIRVPEVPRNIAFGGQDYRTLFITGGHSLYSVRVITPGPGV